MSRSIYFSLLSALIIMALPLSSASHAQCCIEYHGGLDVGYTGGTGAVGYGEILFPISSAIAGVRAAVGFAHVSAGNSTDAREIFINDATNGVPETKGRWWDARVDVLWPFACGKASRTYLVTGLRHVTYTANFKYVGGNEDFDVRSHQWGVGAALEHRIGIGRKLALVLGGGFDYYFEATLQGHDTSYSPSGDDVNARKDFDYSDADAAIDQPRLEPRVTIGFSYLISR